ncbi:MAG: DUF4082 domain-containing protein [Arthrobacter sp.]
MTNYNLFAGTPQISASSDGQSINLGTEFYVTSTCWVTQFRVLEASSGGDGAAVSMALYSTTNGTTGTQVVSPVSVTAGAPGTWSTYTLATPYQLTAGTRYRVVARHPTGYYAATGAFFSTGTGASTTTQGPVVVPNETDAFAGAQGSYNYSASDVFTDGHFNAGGYYSDVTITDVNPNGAIAPSGIASAEAFGTATVSGSLAVSPAGIASAEAFGTAAVNVPLTVSPAGIATREAFGSHFMIATLAVSPAGIASAETIGSAAVSATLTVSPNGVTSGEVFGAATITAQGGAPQTVAPSAIASGEAFGTLTVTTSLEVDPAGITSAAAVGTPGVTVGALVVSPAGIPSPEAFGTAVITQTTYTVTPAGIPSATAFGLASVTGALSGHKVARASLAPRRYQAFIPPKEAPRG